MKLEKARDLLKAHFPIWDSDVANLAYEIVAESCDRFAHKIFLAIVALATMKSG